MTDRPWLLVYDEGVPRRIAYPDVALHTFLDDSARRTPDAVATIFFDATLTYRELSREADRFAAGLQTLGVEKGDRVALQAATTPGAPEPSTPGGVPRAPRARGRAQPRS